MLTETEKKEIFFTEFAYALACVSMGHWQSVVDAKGNLGVVVYAEKDAGTLFCWLASARASSP